MVDINRHSQDLSDRAPGAYHRRVCLVPGTKCYILIPPRHDKGFGGVLKSDVKSPILRCTLSAATVPPLYGLQRVGPAEYALGVTVIRWDGSWVT